MTLSAIAKRRQAQLEALIDAAEARIIADGVSSLKARDLASDIGVALGGLYNIVEDMDMLMLKVAQRTMGRLDAALAAGAASVKVDSPEAAITQLVAIAHAYNDFASGNLRLWRALFEMRLKNPDLPEWNRQAQLGLFRHMTGAIERLRPEADEAARILTTRTLFSAVHGVVVIGLEERLIAVPVVAMRQQIEWLVRAACHDFVR
ncbi:MAG: TetR/AcrR family transcriptional regulator [Asticcacaulis sp.]